MCVSQPAKDLVLKLLERDPTKRLSAEEVLNHPWIEPTSYRHTRGLPAAISHTPLTPYSQALNHPWIALRSEEGGAATGDLSTAYELLKKQVAQKRCVEMRQFCGNSHRAILLIHTPLFTGASRCGTCSRS